MAKAGSAHARAKVLAAANEGRRFVRGYSLFCQTFLEGFQWHGVKKGEAHDFFAGDITVEGPHPFNSSGGNLGTGRTRTAIFTDCIEQLRGQAGERQVRVRAETAAAGCNTPGGNGYIMFGKNPSS